MPRTYKLTWQSGTGKRSGRWRKKYKGQVHYFDGGRGKTDRDAYDASLKRWEQLKVRIDAKAPKRHQADYERSIQKWELVLTWCRRHGEDETARTAVIKQDVLRKELSAAKPRPLRHEDTFEGQFDRSVRFPDYDKSLKEIGDAVVKAEETYEPGLGLPGYEEYLVATKAFISGVVGSSTANNVVIPTAEHDFDKPDPLKVEHEVWRDRLEIMQRTAPPKDQSVQSHIELFLAEKRAAAGADEITQGRLYTLKLHVTHFGDWLGHETPVIEIGGKTLSNYRVDLLENVEARKLENGEERKWSRSTASDRLKTVKSFIRWLWQIDAIPTLPRNMDGKSNALKISVPSPAIVVFDKPEITTLLRKASQRTKLYILLMLNCGMTQRDIADLDKPEVDWESGRVTRKRSKTKEFKSVPEVGYLLWPETLRLLRLERSPADAGPVLLNLSGRPLLHVETASSGKMKKNDNIGNAFHRLRKKTGINKPPKSLKKTSASLIRNNSNYASLERLFLGHAPQSMSDRHYTLPPQTLLDEAITWLGKEYRIVVGEESCEQDLAQAKE